jgi:cell shape-determining protein MreD
MSKIYCISCGSANFSESIYCSNCGIKILKFDEMSNFTKTSLISKIKALPLKEKAFYGFCIYINLVFISELVVGITKPVDRFQNLCSAENLNCAPTGQEMIDHALGNLIIWNFLFLLVRYFYKKRKKKIY